LIKQAENLPLSYGESGPDQQEKPDLSPPIEDGKNQGHEDQGGDDAFQMRG
jgi:hypothetical protein